MRDKKNMDRLGFSLMEIVLALAIVGILAMITLPVINRQLSKADEYSYYLAYKTVEKLGGQIVALGDDEDTSAMLKINDTKLAQEDNSFGKYLSDKFNTNLNRVKFYVNTLGQKFAYTEHHMFQKFFQKSFATPIEISNTEVDFSSDQYDEDWLIYQLCNGAKIPKEQLFKDVVTQNPDGTTTTTKQPDGFSYYTVEPDECIGYTKSSTHGDIKISQNSALTGYVYGPLCNAEIAANILGDYMTKQTGKPNASAACEALSNICNTSDTVNSRTYQMKQNPIFTEDNTEEDNDNSGDDAGIDKDEGNENTVAVPVSDRPGKCTASSFYQFERPASTDTIPEADVIVFSSEDCRKRGYINTYNKPGEGADYLDCVCNIGKVPAVNDDKACVSPCLDGSSTYAKVNSDRSSATAVCCKNDFNEQTGTCCPDNSMYTGSGVCECMNGYVMQGGVCKVSKCSPGSTLVEDPITGDKVCVANASLVKANRFCEKITEHWNIESSSCSASGFQTLDGAHYNSNVFAAASSSAGGYLSVNSQVGTFDDKLHSDMKPNIVFSNGLKMWILGDKSASIPGLSATTLKASGVQNDCKSIKLTSPTAAACSSNGGYFCAGEKRCYKLADAANATVVDARNCCASVDMSDYAKAAQDAGLPNDYKQVSAAYAISGFTVFVDINGDKGSGTLWEDVYPFYVATNGTVYPAYPLDASKAQTNAEGEQVKSSLYIGGNSEKQLPVDVYYYKPGDSNRRKVIAFPNVSFARGVCSARKVSKYTPYCLNLGTRYSGVGEDGNALGSGYIADDSTTSNNPCDKHPCFITVRKKISAF